MRTHSLVFTSLIVVALLLSTPFSFAYAQTYPIRVSVASDGSQTTDLGSAGRPSISANGRYVAFVSASSQLVDNDTNGKGDVFVHDVVTGSTTRVSVATNGTQANNHSQDRVSISADGRYVAFESRASNLISNDTNGLQDIFVHDRETGVTERINVATDGTEADGETGIASYALVISADGRYIIFDSTASNLIPDDATESGSSDYFLRDRTMGTTELVNLTSTGGQSNGLSFTSQASDGVPGDTNSVVDVFVRGRVASTTERVSIASDGTQGNGRSNAQSKQHLSADGRYVVFASDATNLVSSDTNGNTDIFIHDRVSGVTERVNLASDGTQTNATTSLATISADGRYVAFSAVDIASGDTNGHRDVYVKDLVAGGIQRVSLA